MISDFLPRQPVFGVELKGLLKELQALQTKIDRGWPYPVAFSDPLL